MGSFHQSVLEKRSRLEIGSSHTAAKRSITLVASKKLKIMFLEKSIEKNWVRSSEKKSESLKMREKSMKMTFLACFGRSADEMKKCLYRYWSFFKIKKDLMSKLART